MTRSFRYPARTVWLDYAGSASGLALSLVLLIVVRPAAAIAWAAAAVAALFLVYFGRTVCRQLTHIELDEAGIRVTGPVVGLLSASIRWADLCLLRLDYYSTRRDGEEGWMQLRLGDARHTVRIDSDLDDFSELVRVVAHAAAARDLAIDTATAANLKVLFP